MSGRKQPTPAPFDAVKPPPPPPPPRSAMSEILPDIDGVYSVRVHESLVRQLRESPSEPVTVQIEERGGRELVFIFTRHDCPKSNMTIFGLPVVENEALNGIAPVVIGAWCNKTRGCIKAEGHDGHCAAPPPNAEVSR